MTPRTRMFALLVAGLAGFVGACDLEDELENEPCTVAADCWHTQKCNRTAEEEALTLPGLCTPKDSDCFVGAQLGCACNPADPSIDCLAPAVPFALQASYPRMACDPALLVCVIAPPEDGN